MSLREYARKRDFARTPEPRGHARPAPSAAPRFVVQKHAASRLHWDFRLELDGVLKSWAVPKGPSLDPRDKRLAMQVEDHPLEYGDFEGVIPRGEYGGGTVMLWDRGTWTAERDPAEGLRGGSLKFRLDGSRLRGGWALVRMRGRDGKDGDRTWLLLKEKDPHARSGWDAATIEGKAGSVASGRTMARIAATPARVWRSDRAVRGRPAATLPRFVPPQLATLVTQPPDGEQWLHEMKFDGYRLLARLERGRVRLWSRNGKDWTARLAPVAEAVGRLPARSALLDGEAVMLQPDGTTSFHSLQNLHASGGAAAGALTFMAFDLLHRDGRDLTRLPLEERKAELRALLDARPTDDEGIRYSDHVAGGGADVFAEACRLRLEGVLSKRRDAPYRSGRGRDWLKVKCGRRQEVVIGGFTPPAGSRAGLGALLVGVRQGPRLVYAGKVGTGFSAADLQALARRLGALEQRASPFDPAPRMAAARWVKPALVAEVAFTEWTADGKMRHPSFQGLRDDKAPREVTREVAGDGGGAAESPAAAGAATVAGIRLTHPARVLYPKPRVTKLDLARYYEAVADAILPHLADRPTTLLRCPDGIGGACFYQRHAGAGAAAGALRRVKGSGHAGESLVVDSLPALISAVQMGILEIHTWNATVARLERPDRIVLDLDPGPGVPWAGVVDAARLLQRVLKAVGLESFVKTSGGKGLHVVAPIAPAAWAETGAFTRAVAEDLARREPRRFTATMSKAARPGRIYIDYLRNRRAATTVAAYSPRARAGAPVSLPLAWEELSARVPPDRWTIANVPKRLAGMRRDPWARYWTLSQALPAPGAFTR
jgi:bifunctional non-homologous end joining protein LigD